MKTLTIFLFLAATALTVGCGDPVPPPVLEYMAAVDDTTGLDDRHAAIPHLDTAEWVERYLPHTSSSGYNLVFYRRRVPMLMDMQGRVVHSWPGVRGVGRARLDTEGRLTVIGIDNMIKEYDWDGKLTWAYRLPGAGDLPHHDHILLANDNHLVLARGMFPDTEYLHEVDREGRVVWSWRSVDHLERHFQDRDLTEPDPIHINSLFELSENRWFDAGDERFRPGNLLISARNLNAIFIIDKATGEVVWVHDEGLDRQHEAQMVPEGLEGAGLIVTFNNGYDNVNAYRKSEIQAIDAMDGSLRWSYSSPTFFSSVAGAQQVLPNGNLLISSSEGGRVFEITPGKKKVWEWVPPYLPMRVHRYPVGHCPQLVALGKLDRSPIKRADRPRWVDTELSRWAISREWESHRVQGKRRQIVLEPEGCRELYLPPEPVMQVAYGFNDAQLAGAPEKAGFLVTLRDLAGNETRTLVNDTVSSTAEKVYRDKYIPLPGLGLHHVEVCIDAWSGDDRDDGRLHASIFISNPRSYAKQRAELAKSWDRERISAQEQSLEEQQLKALGYVQ